MELIHWNLIDYLSGDMLAKGRCTVLISFCQLAASFPGPSREIEHVLSFGQKDSLNSDDVSGLQIANKELPSQKQVEEKASCAADLRTVFSSRGSREGVSWLVRGSPKAGKLYVNKMIPRKITKNSSIKFNILPKFPD